jgi:hypothetical protein
MFRTLSIVLLLTGAATAAHAADVYRYVDAQGGIHYTDTWVPGSTLIKMDHRPTSGGSAPPSSRPAQSKTLASGEHASADVAKQADVRAMHDDVAQARDDQCKQAKDGYDKAIRSRRIFKADKDGQREYLNDADADAYRVQLRADVQEACGTNSK